MTLQIDSGNVVAVLRENNFYLAYIQDIRDTDVLVNFHCDTLSPAWINSQFVWPQMFFYHCLDWISGKRIQVAVRDERTGPLRFRPGWLISDPEKVLFRTVLYVEWISSSGITSRTVVQRTQIMEGDPLPERSLFSMIRNNAVKPFLKLNLPVKIPCSLTAITSIDLRNLQQLLERLLFVKAEMAEFHYRACYNNFHVTLATDYVLFVFFEISAAISHKVWTNDDIVHVVSQWITQLPLANAGSNGGERNDDTLFKLAHLPDLILHKVLSDLEIHDLVNARRVCRRWKNNLDNIYQMAHIKIDLNRRRQMFFCEEYVWDFGALLDKLLHGRVKTLTILNLDKSPRLNLAVLSSVTSLSALRNIRFRAMALISGESAEEICVGEWGRLSGVWGELQPVTDLLLVRNFKLQGVMLPCFFDDPLQFPAYAGQLLQAQGIPTEKMPLPELFISHILFDFRQSELSNFYTLLKCIERCCPDVLDKDKSVALAIYRYLLSAQLPQRLLKIKEIAMKWKSFDPAGRFGDLSDTEVDLDLTSPTKLFTYAVFSLFKIISS